MKTSSGAWREYKRKPENNHWDWDVGKRTVALRGESIFYAFVDLKWGQGSRTVLPDIFLVPSGVVAKAFEGTKRPRNMFWIMSSERDRYLEAWQPITSRLGPSPGP